MLFLILLLNNWINLLQVYAANYDVTISIDLVADSAGCRVDIDGVSYRDGDVVSLSEGSHSVGVSNPSSWGWSGWHQQSNYVTDPGSSSTTLIVNQNGVFGAVFGYIVTFNTSPNSGGTITADWPSYGWKVETYSNGQSDTLLLQTYILHANPAYGYTFSGWSTSGCGSVDSPTAATTTWNPTGSGVVTANFQQLQTFCSLIVNEVVVGPNEANYIGNPGNGVHTYSPGESVTGSVMSPMFMPGDSDARSRAMRCKGWFGTGSVPASGSGTSVTFTITENSSITWDWQVVTDPLQEEDIYFDLNIVRI